MGEEDAYSEKEVQTNALVSGQIGGGTFLNTGSRQFWDGKKTWRGAFD